MSFRQAAVLAPVSFFLGVLFICFNVDHKILFTELTNQAVEDGFQFYTTFFNAPPAIKALLHALVVVGIIGLVSKLIEWTDSTFFFDGSSIVAYIFSISTYLGVIIPALRTIVEPVPDVDTREDRIEALRVLSAGNIIVIVCLGAILFLQAGQEYAARVESREMAKIIAEEQKKASEVESEKKDQ